MTLIKNILSITDFSRRRSLADGSMKVKYFQTRCKYVINQFLYIFFITILTRWYTSMLGKMPSVATIVEKKPP